MARTAPLIAVLVLAAWMAFTAPASASRLGDWNPLEQHISREEGMLHNYSDGAFHGERRLTAAQLRDVRNGLADRFAIKPVPLLANKGLITVRAFDDLVIRQLGLGDIADRVQRETRKAGLRPPKLFGSEVVARMLEIRHNQGKKDEALELYPWEPITRAEVAWSIAELVELPQSEVTWVRRWLETYRLPRYTKNQRLILRRAVARIGMPFVWGGLRDRAGGGQVHGGFDCSGFLWRVFKGSGLAAGRKLGDRTVKGMAHAIPASQRVNLGHIQPADLTFYARWPRPKKRYGSYLHHSGIALSKRWVISATHQGVMILPLFDDWLWEEFAWGRRVL